jgi:surface protein
MAAVATGGGAVGRSPIIMTNKSIRAAVRAFCEEGGGRAEADFMHSPKAMALYGPLANWDVSQVTDMRSLFEDAAAFNQPLNNWDVSQVTNMRWMFFGAEAFDQPLANWKVDQVTNMHGMFAGATAFNQPLADWTVDQVTDMCFMFSHATRFNQPLADWDVSHITDMSFMFRYAAHFNQPLENWEMGQVTNKEDMFKGATVYCLRRIQPAADEGERQSKRIKQSAADEEESSAATTSDPEGFHSVDPTSVGESGGSGVVVEPSLGGGEGCTAVAFYKLDIFHRKEQAVAALDDEGSRELARRRVRDPDYEELKVFDKGQRWAPAVINTVAQSKGFQMTKQDFSTKTSVLRETTLSTGDYFVDGTKNQVYLKDEKQHVDDPDDPPPSVEPELWRHHAAVRANVLYDAYYPRGISLLRLVLSGEHGYFHTVRKVYRVTRTGRHDNI